MIFYIIQIDYVSATKVQEKADEEQATMMTRDKIGLETRTQVCFYFLFFSNVYLYVIYAYDLH